MTHICTPMRPTCCCYLLADTPSEQCPIHGGALVNRCECGRFVRPAAFFTPPSCAHTRVMWRTKDTGYEWYCAVCGEVTLI